MSARLIRCASLLVLPGISGVLLAAATSPGTPARAAGVSASLLKQVRATFIQNRGQLNGPAQYYVAGRDRTVYFAPEGLTYALRAAKSSAGRYALKLDFVGASGSARITGESRQPGTVSYLTGRRGQQRTHVSTFGGLRYSGLWPGIDLVYQGTETGLKYEYRLQPGADPERIRLACSGADRVRLGADGGLVVSTPAGEVRDAPPISYQVIDGRRVEVASSYQLRRTDRGRVEYGFHLGVYDHSRPLVIDPAVLLYAGYVGGLDSDSGQAVAVDSQGAAYITGQTGSLGSFPFVAGFDSTNGGNTDAFVAKLLPDGSGFAYCSFLGGDWVDQGWCIAVDGSGRAYVGGITDSDPDSFPVVAGPDLTRSDTDGWIARVAADGGSLEYCSYLGGAGTDLAWGIAVDSDNRAYVVGTTEAAEDTLPVTVGPDLTYNGQVDGFITRIAADGSHFEYYGYLGGFYPDRPLGVAVGPGGTAFVTGETHSKDTFPVTVGPDLTFNAEFGALTDAFVAEVAADGSALVYCGYIGGEREDAGSAIAVDSSGAAYVTGTTASSAATFPVRTGPSLKLAGGRDAFVARVVPGGASLDYCGYLGGRKDEEATGLALDADRNVYLCGRTGSDQHSFPVVGGPDLTFQSGFEDGWIARMHAGATGLDYCGYVGGAEVGIDRAAGIAVDPLGRAYLVGTTSSPPNSFPARVGPRTRPASVEYLMDAYVAQVSAFTAPGPGTGRLVISPKKLNGGAVKVGSSRLLKLKLTNRGTSALTLNLPAPAAPFSFSRTGNVTLAAHRSETVIVTFTPAAAGTVTGGIAITSDAPAAPLTVVPLAGRGK